MTFAILDGKDFVDNGVVFEQAFNEKMIGYNWNRFQSQCVLIRGCAWVSIPVWIYLRLTAQWVPIASSIYYGSEHDPVAIKTLK